MRRLVLGLAACLALVAGGAPARAAPAPADDAVVSHSLRCFVVSALMGAEDDPQIKSAGMMAAMYYAGQIFGARPDIDLSAALKAEARKMKSGDIRTVAEQCGQELQARGKQIQAAGTALQDAGRAGSPI